MRNNKIMDEKPFVAGACLGSAVLFVLAINGLTSPESAKRGNWFGLFAMLVAILVSLISDEDINYIWFLPAFYIGTAVGILLAMQVSLAKTLPLLVFTQLLISINCLLVFYGILESEKLFSLIQMIEIILVLFSACIGCAAAFVIFCKLSGCFVSRPFRIFGCFRFVLVGISIFGTIAAGVLIVVLPEYMGICWICVCVCGGIYGCITAVTVGGPDIPMFIGFLNFYIGISVLCIGFYESFLLMVIVGAISACSGLGLGYKLSKLINRNFLKIVFLGFGMEDESEISTMCSHPGDKIEVKTIIKTIQTSASIAIIPGLGIYNEQVAALSIELANSLAENDRKVTIYTHPTAGSFPGHIDLLLQRTQCKVPIVSVNDFSIDFKNIDLALVIGANDIVNPNTPDHSTCGFPVLRVWECKQVIILKRTPFGRGYLDYENPLFHRANTKILFGSIGESLQLILRELKNPRYHIETIQEPDDTFIVSETPLLKDVPKNAMTIGVPVERVISENRVAITPSVVPLLRELGFHVKVERSAGLRAGFFDVNYAEAGAELVGDYDVWDSDIILKIRKIDGSEEDKLDNVKMITSLVSPSHHTQWLDTIAHKYRQLTYIAMDCVPRTIRARRLDCITSTGSLCGYRAVVEAFQVFSRCPKPMVTAAGRIPATQVLVIGAGAAGQAAVGHCKSLGCIVKAIDTRNAVREEIENLGGKFLPVVVKEGNTGDSYNRTEAYIHAQYELIKNTARNSDIIICTALMSGHPAPKLVTEDIVKEMKPGSVIVDLVAEKGGNCTLTQVGKRIVTENGVWIIGFTDWPSRVAPQASEMYASHLFHLLKEIGGSSHFFIDANDELIGSMVVIKDGKMMWYMRPSTFSTALVMTGKIVARLPIPIIAADRAKTSIWPQIDFLLYFLLIFILFLAISYGTYNEESFLAYVLLLVMSGLIGLYTELNVRQTLITPSINESIFLLNIVVCSGIKMMNKENDLKYLSYVGALSVFVSSVCLFAQFTMNFRMVRHFKAN